MPQFHADAAAVTERGYPARSQVRPLPTRHLRRLEGIWNVDGDIVALPRDLRYHGHLRSRRPACRVHAAHRLSRAHYLDADRHRGHHCHRLGVQRRVHRGHVPAGHHRGEQLDPHAALLRPGQVLLQQQHRRRGRGGLGLGGDRPGAAQPAALPLRDDLLRAPARRPRVHHCVLRATAALRDPQGQVLPPQELARPAEDVLARHHHTRQPAPPLQRVQGVEGDRRACGEPILPAAKAAVLLAEQHGRQVP
mmetsp:Transcript_6785/g.16921  ORF Transcript_6785/g.16921 Transcript_6785/m.16921 type:complete len:250 (-) Transcript_6785:413-1162(-)